MLSLSIQRMRPLSTAYSLYPVSRLHISSSYSSSSSSSSSSPPLITIHNATFYRTYPTPNLSPLHNPPLFPNLSFTLPSSTSSPPQQHWAVLGSSGKTAFLHVLRGQYICIPPSARSFPYLSTPDVERRDYRLRFPGFAIKYVGFDGGGGRAGGGAYLSARYESRREAGDFTVLRYLRGEMELNPVDRESSGGGVEGAVVLERVVRDLELEALLEMPVARLSHGQMRRARIARALMERPEVVLLDEPFMGLDPPTVQRLSPLLYNLAVNGAPRLLMALRPQDPVPDWVTHLVILGEGNTVALQGERAEVLRTLDIWKAVSSRAVISTPGTNKKLAGLEKSALSPRSAQEDAFYNSLSSKDQTRYDHAEQLHAEHRFETETQILHDFGLSPTPIEKSDPRTKPTSSGDPIIEMAGVRVRYGDKTVLGDWHQPIDGRTAPGLHWTVHRGQRWGVFGLNGCGKTTLISLITSDHPQAYALPIKLFGRSRLPEPGTPGLSVFDLQRRIGHSSPEVHTFFPRHVSIRAALESAWADTFLARPKLDAQRRRDVDSALRFFAADLHAYFVPWAERASSSVGDGNDWMTTTLFSQLTIAQQRLVLFLRAVVHKPELIVLDEAFAGMAPALRDKCLHFLEVGETRTASSSGWRRGGSGGWDAWRLPPEIASGLSSGCAVRRHSGLSAEQSLIVISHVKEEVPDVVSHWMVLPSGDEGGELRLRMGTVGDGKRIASREVWEEIWEVPSTEVLS
ncbi:hypothetical protein PRK78_002426 [Emydomyces testavorans]|uniref:ABC transporter domain-containing protein n=1 Tax=Emydomyces testavorans TaxID=2070801 RepID=A0AAF0IHK6_9EURO|nr:hypothetical protein PRK78_002426 [Emydomyces testavorans]